MKTWGYWNYERCQKEALKYKYRKDFKNNSSSAYWASNKKGWLNEICSHMSRPIPYNYIWTYGELQKEALKYKTKKDFRKYSSGAYDAAYKNNYLDKICKNMLTLNSKNKRCIYAVLFNNKHVYVGLTYNFEKRKNEHLNNLHQTTVFKFMSTTNLIPHFLKITDYIDVETSKQKENEYVEFFKTKNYIILNRIKTGGLGAVKIHWNKINCEKEALKFHRRCDFKTHSSSAYKSALLNGWLNDICSHMKHLRFSNYHWTYDKCKEEVLKYKSKEELRENNSSVYSIIYKRKWVNLFSYYVIN